MEDQEARIQRRQDLEREQQELRQELRDCIDAIARWVDASLADQDNASADSRARMNEERVALGLRITRLRLAFQRVDEAEVARVSDKSLESVNPATSDV